MKAFDFDQVPATQAAARTIAAANAIFSRLSVAQVQGTEASPREIVEAALRMLKKAGDNGRQSND